ncbi:amino acid adenylation domain-containing protein [Caballeronia sp. SEWSISQ10-4 2]|uniref:non-ribosomal peptide synthetase n=1 Tax=Caballeronia sp. SEWSISQ10-4 2 TaxID=2937438 RepID=UPI002653BB49|nr:amino acid adenylation domain-containing protein [Caballeronia sp. SEWSISQ10-4 2]MDN7183621.1 amino acid adenylation domain-containing protein [Caballeronia sp. SEWSISQ10-4 2]
MSVLHREIVELLLDGAALWTADGQIRFRAPPGVMSAPRATLLREHKAALLAYLDARGATTDAPLDASRWPASGETRAPLTTAQQEMWLVEQIGCGTAYSMPAAIDFDGVLDLAALSTSLDALRERHASLRTRIVETGDGPQQQIDPPGPTVLDVFDLSDLDAHTQQAEAERIALDWARAPFDLASAALLRARLVRLADERYRLLLNLHHLVADGWSMAVLANDLTALYRAAVSGTPAALDPPTVQYGDYAWWQRARAARRGWERQLPYWREQLLDVPATLNLPHDFTRPAQRDFAGDEVPFALDAATTQQLKALARTHQTTVFTTLLAAFQIVLSRWSAQDDLVIGVPTAGRESPQASLRTEQMIGLFVNILPVRARFADDDTFCTALDRAKRGVEGAFAHGDVPFSELVGLSNVPRDASQQALTQVAFVFENMPRARLALPGVEIEQRRLRTTTSKFDLTLFAGEQDDAIDGYLEYSTGLFTRSTMARFVDSLQRLIVATVREPGLSIWRLPLLPADDDASLASWHGESVPFDATRRLPDLFDDQVRRDPQRVALITDDEQISYGELDVRANQLARYLQRRGIGPEAVVGVCVERSPAMIVAMLAVLKAGGAYLPLDAAYPRERLKLMADDCGAALILVGDELGASLVGIGSCMSLGTIADEVAREDPSVPPSTATARNLAYIIYTSGSTGRPKGVAIEHRNVLALHAWAVREYSADELSNVIASTSICFDISVFEIFVPLMSGGAVTVAAGPLTLPRAAAQARILNTVPSAAAHLLQSGAIPASITVVNVAGEPLTPRLVAALYDGTCAKRVYNLYGPSEDTTYSTFAHVPTGVDPVPIGRPQPNTLAYVLDRYLQPVPAGVTGELYLGGSGVSRGYFGRPELTSQRYIDNPFGTGGRLYRTGDLVRFGADGQLYCLGRCDEQIKLRGFRIELGEIEASLVTHPDVEQAVVVARDAASGEGTDGSHGGAAVERFLVAYVVPAGGAQIDSERLRRHLRASLTEAMVPAVFMAINALPRLPNGKLNRSALPVPSRNKARTAYAPPITELQKAVAAIWAEVLGVGEVGVHDAFFECGGHSLKAAQVIHLIGQRLGVTLSLASMFRDATVARLADEVDARLAAGRRPCAPGDTDSNPCVVLLRERKENFDDQRIGSLFLLHPAGGNLFGYVELLRHLRFGGRIFGVQRLDLAAGDAPELQTATVLADRYASAIGAIDTGGGCHLLGWSFGGLLAHLVAARLSAANVTVRYAAALDTCLPDSPSASLLATLEACDGRPVHQALAKFPADLVERVRAMAEIDRSAHAGTSTQPVQESIREDVLSPIAAAYIADVWAMYVHVGRRGFEGSLAALSHRYYASRTVAQDRFAQEQVAAQTARVFEGDHFSVLRPETAALLATWIDTDLSDVQAAALA